MRCECYAPHVPKWKSRDSNSQEHVTATLANSEEFSRAWQCPVGSLMNPQEKCRIWWIHCEPFCKICIMKKWNTVWCLLRKYFTYTSKNLLVQSTRVSTLILIFNALFNALEYCYNCKTNDKISYNYSTLSYFCVLFTIIEY